MLTRAGVVVSRRKATEIVRLTEGWAAGVYLAALSLKARAAEGATRFKFSGNHRLVRDYLRLELVSRLDEDEIRFLTRTSVLDRICGSLCDGLVERDDSAAVIESLEQSQLLVVPLDSEREWYRYHNLFRQMLRGELDRREPHLADELNRRAADWCELNDAPEAAIDYAARAGEDSRVERLVEDVALTVYRAGRAEVAKRWLDNLDDETARRRPALGLFAVWLHALDGRALDAQRWADEVQQPPRSGPGIEKSALSERSCARCSASAARLGCWRTRRLRSTAFRSAAPGDRRRCSLPPWATGSPPTRTRRMHIWPMPSSRPSALALPMPRRSRSRSAR